MKQAESMLIDKLKKKYLRIILIGSVEKSIIRAIKCVDVPNILIQHSFIQDYLHIRMTENKNLQVMITLQVSMVSFRNCPLT